MENTWKYRKDKKHSYSKLLTIKLTRSITQYYHIDYSRIKPPLPPLPPSVAISCSDSVQNWWRYFIRLFSYISTEEHIPPLFYLVAAILYLTDRYGSREVAEEQLIIRKPRFSHEQIQHVMNEWFAKTKDKLE